MEPPNLLVAENETIIKLDLNITLEKWGFNVEANFRTGRDLLEFAKADEPDILIMDVFLPGKMDTFTAAKEILETKNVSVIFLTTDPVSDNNTDIKIDGKVKFLQIPFTDNDL